MSAGASLAMLQCALGWLSWSLLVGALANRIPTSWLGAGHWIWRRPWRESRQGFESRLAIRSWKGWLPDAGNALPKGVAKAALVGRNRADLERLLAGRAQLVDHRPLGYGRLGKPATIDMVMTPATGSDRGLMIATALLEAVGPTAVLPFTRLFVTEEGESWEAAGGYVTALVHDGHVIRGDLYAEDDLDSALAQAARFEPALGGPDAPDLPDGWFYDGTIDPVWLAERGPLEVEAADVTLRFVDAVAVADVDALDATLDPDFATDDHRPVGWGPRAREDFRDAVGQRPTTLGTGVAHGEFLLQLRDSDVERRR